MVESGGSVTAQPVTVASNGLDAMDSVLEVDQHLHDAIDLSMADAGFNFDQNGALEGENITENAVSTTKADRGSSPEVQELYFPPLEKSNVDALPMASLRTGLCYDTRMGAHSTLLENDDHPEDPLRIEYIHNALHRAGLVADDHGVAPDPKDVLHRILARMAKPEEVQLVHTAEHYERMRETRGIPIRFASSAAGSSDRWARSGPADVTSALARGRFGVL